MKRSEYILYTAIALGLVGLIALYVLEFDWFNRTFHAKTLVLVSIIAGALLGLGLGYRFREKGEDLTGRVQIYVFFTVLCALFMPLFASLSNRLLSPYPEREVPVEFIGEEGYYANRFGLVKGEMPEPTGYYLFFYHEGELHRITNDRPLFPDQERGDTVRLNMRKGLWGVRYVLKDQN